MAVRCFARSRGTHDSARVWSTARCNIRSWLEIWICGSVTVTSSWLTAGRRRPCRVESCHSCVTRDGSWCWTRRIRRQRNARNWECRIRSFLRAPRWKLVLDSTYTSANCPLDDVSELGKQAHASILALFQRVRSKNLVTQRRARSTHSCSCEQAHKVTATCAGEPLGNRGCPVHGTVTWRYELFAQHFTDTDEFNDRSTWPCLTLKSFVPPKSCSLKYSKCTNLVLRRESLWGVST